MEKLTCPLESLLEKLTCPRESRMRACLMAFPYSALLNSYWQGEILEKLTCPPRVPTRTNLRNLTHIEMQGIDTTTGEIKATARFDIRPFRI